MSGDDNRRSYVGVWDSVGQVPELPDIDLSDFSACDCCNGLTDAKPDKSGKTTCHACKAEIDFFVSLFVSHWNEPLRVMDDSFR